MFYEPLCDALRYLFHTLLMIVNLVYQEVFKSTGCLVFLSTPVRLISNENCVCSII